VPGVPGGCTVRCTAEARVMQWVTLRGSCLWCL